MRLLRALIYSAALSLACAQARADVAGDDAARKAESVTLGKEGIAHARKGDYEAARQLFAKAFELSPSTALLFNWALAELSSGHELEALRHFRRFIHDPEAEPSKVSIVRNDLLPKAYAATGHVSLEKAPANARLTIDGHDPGEHEEALLDVAPGAHELIARTPTQSWRASVTVAAGQRVIAPFELAAVPQPPPASPPPPPFAAPKPVRPAPAAGLSHENNEEPFWSPRRTTGLSILTAAAVADAIAIGFLVDAENARSTDKSLSTGLRCTNPAPSDAGPCSDAQAARDRAKRDTDVFDAALITGGALTAVSFLVLQFWPEPSAETSGTSAVSVRPVFDPVAGRAGIAGRF